MGNRFPVYSGKIVIHDFAIIQILLHCFPFLNWSIPHLFHAILTAKRKSLAGSENPSADPFLFVRLVIVKRTCPLEIQSFPRRAIESFMTGEIALVEQEGDDHAERRGFSPIIAIGADSPTLPSAILKTAVESFRESDADLVLGGTRDGGYYLIGLRKMVPSIFDGVSWSSDHVYAKRSKTRNESGFQTG